MDIHNIHELNDSHSDRMADTDEELFPNLIF